MKAIFVATAFAAGLFVTGALAQHEQHQQSQAAPSSGDAKNAPAKASGMMAAHEETGKLVDQLVKNFEAIDAEQAPADLKEKLAEHGKLLRDLQAKFHDQAKMMETMQGKMKNHE